MMCLHLRRAVFGLSALAACFFLQQGAGKRVNWPLFRRGQDGINQCTWWSLPPPPVLFAPFKVTVINELRDVITQPSLCTPTPIESAASYLVSRMFLLCDLKEAVFCPFLCGRQQMEGGGLTS